MKLTEKLLAIGDVPTTEGEALTPDEWQALQQAAAALDAAEKALTDVVPLLAFLQKLFAADAAAAKLIPGGPVNDSVNAALTLIRGDAK